MNHTVVASPALRSTPHFAASMSTIRSPRPVGSVGPGERMLGFPPTWSVTSMRISRGVCMIVSSNPPSACFTQFEASSETISATTSSVSADARCNASVANRLAELIDAGACSKRRV